MVLSLNLSAHASSPVIRYTSKGSEKMLVILRQGLHLFPEKEAHFPAMQSGLCIYAPNKNPYALISWLWLSSKRAKYLIKIIGIFHFPFFL